MIYLTGDCKPGDLKIICPSCRVLLKWNEVASPRETLHYAYLSCRTPECTHENVIRVRYSWPLPPMFFEDPTFWSQADDRERAVDTALTCSGALDQEQLSIKGGAACEEMENENDGAATVEAPERGNPMGQKTPALMHQLSAREKMIYQLYAAKRLETPLSVEYSLPVGHEFLLPQAGADVGSIPDTDPRLYRIDVIEVYTDHIFLIEVKTTADLKAYGQLHAYSMLYTMHYKPGVPVVPLLIFEHASQILIGVCLSDEIPMYPVSIDTALS